MLKSKILIISTMILFILSISAVNAENVTSSMVNDTVNNEFHVIDGKYLKYNNSENGKNLNDTSNVLYDGKDGSVLENKNSNDAIFKYDGNNTVVSKEKPKMNVIAEDSIIFGENLTIYATLNGVNNTNLTGNVIVTINNKNYSVVVINGKGNVSADRKSVV